MESAIRKACNIASKAQAALAVDICTIIWYIMQVKLSIHKVESLCKQQNTGIGEMLHEADVSRNAFYSLARKKSVVPQSLIRIAEHLGVSVLDLLDETFTPTERIKFLIKETKRILKQHKDADFDNVRHTLLLLDEKPIERLRRALRRGRSFNFR